MASLTISFLPSSTWLRTIKARIWDAAGQERYRAITRSHYRRADGALLVYDVADPDSFTKLGEWLKTLQEMAGDSLKRIMVVENKADQLPEATALHRACASQRPSALVQQDDVSTFCQMHGLLFARATAEVNATAFKWDAQRVGDTMRHLVLSIHVSTLARTTNGLAPISVGPTRHGAENGGSRADRHAEGQTQRRIGNALARLRLLRQEP